MLYLLLSTPVLSFHIDVDFTLSVRALLVNIWVDGQVKNASQ